MNILRQCLKKQIYAVIVLKKNKQMMKMTGSIGETKTVELEDVKLDLSFMEDSKLILFNDDHNSFDKVIMALMIYCEISSARAAEFAMRIHNEGKAVVKYGSRDKLEPIAKVFGDLDLTCEIEDP
jgi:ATP-dependent Clp protease adaptor protein ClpS